MNAGQMSMCCAEDAARHAESHTSGMGGVGYVVWVGRGGGRVDWSIGRVVRVGYDFCCRFGDRYARQNINSHIFSTGNDLAISVHRWLLT